MAKTTTTTLDTSAWDAAFAKLNGPVKESLARTMAVAGGQVMRDEAKANALQSHAKTTWIPNPVGPSQSSQDPGTLAEAIYLARNNKLSQGSVYTYSISWNNTQAWWGRLREFGWTQTSVIFKTPDGMYHTIKDRLLPTPIVHPAVPFLAPAYDATLNQLADIMVAEGRKQLPRIISENSVAGS